MAAIALTIAGSDSGGGAGNQGGGTSGTADCGIYESVGEAPACDNQCAVANEEFCAGIDNSADCDDLRPGAKVDVCGVGVAEPTLGGEL